MTKHVFEERKVLRTKLNDFAINLFKCICTTKSCQWSVVRRERRANYDNVQQEKGPAAILPINFLNFPASEKDLTKSKWPKTNNTRASSCENHVRRVKVFDVKNR